MDEPRVDDQLSHVGCPTLSTDYGASVKVTAAGTDTVYTLVNRMTASKSLAPGS